MIFKVQNLGYIEEAEVDLSKDLIIFTGQNNTGKTYLAYAIYGLLNHQYSKIDLDLKDIQYDKNFIKVKYEIVLSKYKKSIKNDVKNLRQFIGEVFSSSNLFFDNTRFDVAFRDSDFLKMNPNKKFEYTLQIHEPSLTFEESKLGLEFNLNYDIIKRLFQRTYIAPAERNAVNIFSKELSLTKNKLFKNRNGNGLIKDAQFVNRYPKPVQDNLEIAEDLAFLSKNKSDFEYLAIELEQDFLKGKISTNQYGQIEYTPDNQKDINLEIHLTASMVKSLSNIVFYLRHLAQKGDCIIIDEPELNLHPDNQRKIARFIGRLINEGFQVVISTHSDYIIKELNNMIMLSKAKENQELVKKLGFRGDELVNPEQVQALLFTLESRKPSTIEVTEEGFSVKTIDETIAKQDALTEEIYYQLFEQEPV
ncbi:MAG: AAA family ATPase [Saprospiraceae bacterium]